MKQLAVTLDTWEEVNDYLNDGWRYIDSKIVSVKKNKWAYYFILEKGNESTRVIINRSRR